MRIVAPVTSTTVAFVFILSKTRDCVFVCGYNEAPSGTESDARSCVKVEGAVLGSLSLISFMKLWTKKGQH